MPAHAGERITADHKPETFPLRDYWQVLTKPELVRLFLAQMGPHASDPAG